MCVGSWALGYSLDKGFPMDKYSTVYTTCEVDNLTLSDKIFYKVLNAVDKITMVTTNDSLENLLV